MPNPIFTTASPSGGLVYTIANFSTLGDSDVVTLTLTHSCNTKNFHATPTSSAHTDGYSYPATPSEIFSYRGVVWTRIELPLVGDYGQSMVDLATVHMRELARMGRETYLDGTFLFQWLDNLWKNVKTYFIASRQRNLEDQLFWEKTPAFLEDGNLWNPIPFTMTFTCPAEPPASIVVKLPDITVPANPANTPANQIHVPNSVPFSQVVVDTPVIETQALAEIMHPALGLEVPLGNPQTFLANALGQTDLTHTFTWFFADRAALSGQRIRVTFVSIVPGQTVPVTLLVTNKSTGVSAVTATFVKVVSNG